MNAKHAQVDEALPVARAARVVGVHAQTLRQYEAQGLISAFRTPGGQRRYRVADLHNLRQHGTAFPTAEQLEAAAS